MTPRWFYIQPHFFNDDGSYRGGLTVGASFHVEVSTIAGGDAIVTIEAAYSLGSSSEKFVRATPLPYMHVHAGSYTEDILPYIMPYLECRGSPDCVADQIEKAFEDALDAPADPNNPDGPTIRQTLPFVYPGGLTPQDILDVIVLPTGIDFVVRPEKCPQNWIPNFELVDFETGLVPKSVDPAGSHVGYCSFAE